MMAWSDSTPSSTETSLKLEKLNSKHFSSLITKQEVLNLNPLFLKLY